MKPEPYPPGQWLFTSATRMPREYFSDVIRPTGKGKGFAYRLNRYLRGIFLLTEPFPNRFPYRRFPPQCPNLLALSLSYHTQTMGGNPDGTQQRTTHTFLLNDLKRSENKKITQNQSLRDSLAPQVGLEPTTFRLTAERSAIELLRNIRNAAATYSPGPSPAKYHRRAEA